MAAKGDALQDAIALLDTIISRLSTSSQNSSHPTTTPRISKEIQSHTTPSAIVSSMEIPGGVQEEMSEDFNKAHLQVGCVVSVDDHPVADKLYVCKVEVAKGEVRQVVAGLRKFLPSSKLLGKKVCLLLNLKPAKLAGQLSEAMILAGEVSNGSESPNVRILEPPQDASVGDRIYLEDSSPSSNPVKQLSSKIWEKIASRLSVDGGVANFNKRSMVTSSGLVMGHGLPDGAHVH